MMNRRQCLAIAAAIAICIGIAARSHSQSRVARRIADDIPLGLMSPVYPNGRPPSGAEASLGKRLFFDPVLSVDSTISCATCHDPAHAFAESRATSRGVGGVLGERNAPTLLNVAFADELSWDGRHASLEEQALEAISNPTEMGLDARDIAARVEAQYGDDLRRAYGEVSPATVARALGAFQRTLLAGDSPFDRYIFAGDAGAISDSAKHGFKVFLRHGRCIQCHTMRCDDCHPFGGATAFLENGRFHNLGVGLDGDNRDLGRQKVTRNIDDHAAFKTPSLRNVALTAPYMHDGSLATLRDVIEHYDKGGVTNPQLDPEIKPLHLTEQEKDDLVAFLESLTSPQVAAGRQP